MNDSKVINPLFDFSELRRKSDDQNYLTKFSENTA